MSLELITLNSFSRKLSQHMYSSFHPIIRKMLLAVIQFTWHSSHMSLFESNWNKWDLFYSVCDTDTSADVKNVVNGRSASSTTLIILHFVRKALA